MLVSVSKISVDLANVIVEVACGNLVIQLHVVLNVHSFHLLPPFLILFLLLLQQAGKIELCPAPIQGVAFIVLALLLMNHDSFLFFIGVLMACWDAPLDETLVYIIFSISIMGEARVMRVIKILLAINLPLVLLMHRLEVLDHLFQLHKLSFNAVLIGFLVSLRVKLRVSR
jgi:hypothetical protein